jgi:hypothetical protein
MLLIAPLVHGINLPWHKRPALACKVPSIGKADDGGRAETHVPNALIDLIAEYPRLGA